MRGHIAKKGNKYYIVVDVRDESTGKRKRKWLTGEDGKGFDRTRDAEREMPAVLKRFYEGTISASKTETLGELVTRWLNDKKKSVRFATWKSYEWLITKHLIPHLGSHKADKLKQKHFRTLYNEKLAPILAAASIRKLHFIVNQALNRAVIDGDIPRNVANDMDLPIGKGTKKFDTWDEPQLDLFLEYARDDQFFMVYELASSTGMGKSEVLGLPRHLVDLNVETAYVRQAYVKAEVGYDFDDPKNETRERPVPLFPNTVRYLKEHFAKQEEERMKNKKFYKDHGLVFQTSTGTPVNQRNMMRNFYKIMKKIIEDQEAKKAKNEPYIEFKKIRFHDLRHTHATILLKKDVHPKVVQERLGHSSIQVTLDIYSHVIPDMQKAILRGLGDSITGASYPALINDTAEKPEQDPTHLPFVTVDYDEGDPNTYRGFVVEWEGRRTRINSGSFSRDYEHVMAEYSPLEKSRKIENYIQDAKGK